MKAWCAQCDLMVVFNEYASYVECPLCGAILLDKREESLHRPWE